MRAKRRTSLVSEARREPGVRLRPRGRRHGPRPAYESHDLRRGDENSMDSRRQEGVPLLDREARPLVYHGRREGDGRLQALELGHFTRAPFTASARCRAPASNSSGPTSVTSVVDMYARVRPRRPPARHGLHELFAAGVPPMTTGSARRRSKKRSEIYVSRRPAPTVTGRPQTALAFRLPQPYRA